MAEAAFSSASVVYMRILLRSTREHLYLTVLRDITILYWSYLDNPYRLGRTAN
jgi:hypothetical protein